MDRNKYEFNTPIEAAMGLDGTAETRESPTTEEWQRLKSRLSCEELAEIPFTGDWLDKVLPNESPRDRDYSPVPEFDKDTHGLTSEFWNKSRAEEWQKLKSRLTKEELAEIPFTGEWLDIVLSNEKPRDKNYIPFPDFDPDSSGYEEFERAWIKAAEEADGDAAMRAVEAYAALQPDLTAIHGLKAFIAPLATRTFDQIEIKDVEWFWEPFVPFGFFTLCDGEEGIGKTYMLQERASFASSKGLNVLWLSEEDSPEVILKPRFEKLEADCSRIHLLDSALVFTPEGLGLLEATIAAKRIRLVVVDPIFSYTGRSNIDSQSDVRVITDALGKMADANRCAIIGVRHFAKAKGNGDPRNAGAHSIGWRTGCRSALLVGCDPSDRNERGVAQTKLNVGKRFEGVLGFEIDGTGTFRWKPETHLTVEVMLSAPQQSRSQRTATGKEEARQMRANGMSLREIAEALGVSHMTVSRWLEEE